MLTKALKGLSPSQRVLVMMHLFLGAGVIIAAALGRWALALTGLSATLTLATLTGVLTWSVGMKRMYALNDRTIKSMSRLEAHRLWGEGQRPGSKPTSSTEGLGALADGADRSRFAKASQSNTRVAGNQVDLVAARKTVRQFERKSSTSGSVHYWAELIADDSARLNWFVNQAKKNRSLGARDVIAYAATRGAMQYQGLALLLESSRVPKFADDVLRRVELQFKRHHLLALARVVYSQRVRPFDLWLAFCIYDVVERVWGLQSIRNGVDRSYYADLLVDFSKANRVEDVLNYAEKNEQRKYGQQFLAANSINPYLGTQASLETWLTKISEALSRRGFSPVHLREGAQPPFYRLASYAPAARNDSALVSILMPIYEPNAATDLAIASLLAQSWHNLELLIVDDGSPSFDENGEATTYRQQLLRWQEADDRVRVIFNEKNRGAYWARNTAYAAARGKYVTVADKDDWHHPQKIEFQAAELEGDASIPANMTNWIRVDENMRFLLRWGPDRLVHPSFASIMYRRQEVLSAIGYWDNVRKAGDGEFKYRFQQVFGVDLQPTELSPLAFSLMGESNLTGTDLGLGYEDDDRAAYRHSFARWHQSIRVSGGSAYLPMEPAERPFPAPYSFLPDRPSYGKFDIVYASEFGFEAGNSTSLANELNSFVSAGLAVGVLPMSNFLIESAARRHMTDKTARLIEEGHVVRVPRAASVATKLLIVRWPAVMQVARDVATGLKPDRVVVIANHVPYEETSSRRSYDVITVTENIERAFGVTPEWVPQSARVRAVLEDVLPSSLLSNETWNGVIPVGEADSSESRVVGEGRPVIGRHGRDHVGKWPETRDSLVSAYPVDRSVSVRIMGGASVPVKAGLVTEAELATWEILRFNEIPVEEYLGQLDFFVYYPHSSAIEAFGMAVVEALARGVVCILPSSFSPVFGNAAIYCEPAAVQERVWELWGKPSKYLKQQDAGYRYVHTHASPAKLLKTITAFGVEVADVA